MSLTRIDVAVGDRSRYRHSLSMDLEVIVYLRTNLRTSTYACTNTWLLCAGIVLRGSAGVESTRAQVTTAKVATAKTMGLFRSPA